MSFFNNFFSTELRSLIDLPLNLIDPSKLRRFIIAFPSVDLPEPDSPTTPTVEFLGIFKEISETAQNLSVLNSFFDGIL